MNQDQVRELFERLIDEDAQTREQALADPSIAPDVVAEVRALLDRALRMPAGFLADQPSAETPFQSIGPYHITRVLGEGGMGRVYEAEQTHPIRRTVAIKVLKPGMDSSELLARFDAERDALAKLDHPHVARVIEAGQSRGRHPYFVMELVRGRSITQFCEQERLDIDQRLRLFVQVCQAILREATSSFVIMVQPTPAL